VIARAVSQRSQANAIWLCVPLFATIGPTSASSAIFARSTKRRFTRLFLEVLRVANEMDVAKSGNLSTGRTKIRANASDHKASYGHMNKESERLAVEIEQ
jgi:hypothetical protein